MRSLRTLSVFSMVMLAQAQDAPPAPEKPVLVRGEVSSDRALNLMGYCVEMQNLSAHEQVACIPVSFDGHFEASLPAGAYRVRVNDAQGRVVREDFANISQHQFVVGINVPGSEASTPGSGTVSAARLAHRVPGKAAREFALAMRDSREDRSFEHLRRAVEIDPAFAEAHNNLGARYIERGELGQAAAEFRKAVDVDPGAGTSLQNLAQTLVRLEQYPEAESIARRALRADPTSIAARYILGSALLAQRKFSDEALSLLEAASPQYAGASLSVAQIYYARHDKRNAAIFLHRYLDSGGTQQRDAALAALAQIER